MSTILVTRLIRAEAVVIKKSHQLALRLLQVLLIIAEIAMSAIVVEIHLRWML